MRTGIFLWCATVLAALSSPLTAYELVSGSAEPYCREYTETVTIGNKTQTAYGTACMQPDGSWQKVTDAQLPPKLASQQTVVVQQPVIIREQQPVIIRQERIHRTGSLWPFFSIRLGSDRDHWHRHGHHPRKYRSSYRHKLTSHNHRGDRHRHKGNTPMQN